MSVVETLTFRLAAGADEAAFLAADRLVQTEFSPNLPGFIRRTTARGDDGGWIVVTLWGADEHADAALKLAEHDGAVQRFASLLDASSVVRRRYATLD